MRVRIITWGVLALLSSVLAGCSPDNPLGRQGVSGTVTYNGKPAPSGSVTLMPLGSDKTTPSGAQIFDGKFKMPPETGVVPGEYSVVVSIPDPDWAPSPQAKIAKEAAPAQWQSGQHKITVGEGGRHDLTFDVVNDKPIVYDKAQATSTSSYIPNRKSRKK